MFSLISALTTPTALLKTQSLAYRPATAGNLKGGHTASRVRDNFKVAVGVGHAADIGALTSATGNSRAGGALLQVADRGLAAIDDALTAMKVLAERASSTTAPLSHRERAILNAEFQILRAEIDRIADQTEFNGIKVLKGVTVVEESIETVTQSYSTTNLGPKIGIDNGFQNFVMVSSPNGLLDGDRIRIEYDKHSGLFTVTNTTTGQVVTKAAPATAPAEGQTTDVFVSEFGLTIQVNSNFNPNKPNQAPSGNPGQNEFVVSVTTSTTTTTATSKNVAEITFRVGTGTASQDQITIVLPAATIADLEPGLATGEINSVAGANQALTDVANARDALKLIQASVDGNTARFQAAHRIVTAGKTILKDLKADLLETPATIDTANRLANLVNEQFLSHAKPALTRQISTAMRDLLLSASPQPLEPPEVANGAAAREATWNEAGIGTSAYKAVPQSSHREPYKRVDVMA